jgi:hypothetical protein
MLEGVCGSARKVDCGGCLEALLGAIYLIDDRTKAQNEVKNIKCTLIKCIFYITTVQPFKSAKSLKKKGTPFPSSSTSLHERIPFAFDLFSCRNLVSFLIATVLCDLVDNGDVQPANKNIIS